MSAAKLVDCLYDGSRTDPEAGFAVPNQLGCLLSLAAGLDRPDVKEWLDSAALDQPISDRLWRLIRSAGGLVRLEQTLLHRARHAIPISYVGAPAAAVAQAFGDLLCDLLKDVAQPAREQAPGYDTAMSAVAAGQAIIDDDGSVFAVQTAASADWETDLDAADAAAATELECVVIRLELFPAAAAAAAAQIAATRQAAAEAMGHGHRLHVACLAAPGELIGYQMAANRGAGHPDAALETRIDAALAACGPAIDQLGRCLAAAS